MNIAVTPSESDTFTVLRSWLLDVLPAGVEVIKAQINRVPEPKVGDFVVMTPVRRPRLTTNVDTCEDTFLSGSISGKVLTVASVAYGTIATGNQLFGPTVADNTIIGAQTGPTTWAVSVSQNISLGPLACGVQRKMQELQFGVQLDVHGPNSLDNSTIISTLFRDAQAVDFFNGLNPNITPLYTTEPAQIPFINDQDQYENRWIVETEIQVNATIVVPQQFADALNVELIEIDSTYPPS